MSKQGIAGGVVHKVPADLRKAPALLLARLLASLNSKKVPGT